MKNKYFSIFLILFCIFISVDIVKAETLDSNVSCVLYGTGFESSFNRDYCLTFDYKYNSEYYHKATINSTTRLISKNYKKAIFKTKEGSEYDYIIIITNDYLVSNTTYNFIDFKIKYLEGGTSGEIMTTATNLINNQYPQSYFTGSQVSFSLGYNGDFTILDNLSSSKKTEINKSITLDGLLYTNMPVVSRQNDTIYDELIPEINQDIIIDVSDDDINISNDSGVVDLINKNNVFFNKSLGIITPLIAVVSDNYIKLPNFLKLGILVIFVCYLIYLLFRRLTKWQ